MGWPCSPVKGVSGLAGMGESCGGDCGLAGTDRDWASTINHVKARTAWMRKTETRSGNLDPDIADHPSRTYKESPKISFVLKNSSQDELDINRARFLILEDSAFRVPFAS